MKRSIVLLIILIVLFSITFWATGIKSVGIFKMAPPKKVITATLKHLQIVGFAEFLAIVVGIPIGFIATRKSFKFFSKILLLMANIGQTVPTLAFIGISGAVLGMGYKAAVVALFVYALLPIIRNTYAGINSIENSIKEAATGMGMSKIQIIKKIELPLALPVMIAGIRTSTVVNVGTAAVAGMIGAGGLGELIVTGIAVRVIELTIQGAAPTAALAILLDYLLGLAGDIFTPRGLKIYRKI